jgi:hypothetical protein
MKVCPVCGRQAPADAARCAFDGNLLEDREEATRLRARPAEPVAPPRFTVEDISRPVAPASSSPTVPAANRPLWPATVAIAIAATIGVGAFIYYLASQRSREVDSINAQIADARIAVADAKARIESLPVENPLRQKIITLDKWDRELQTFQLGSERSREMAARARDILSQAEKISDDARSAGATMHVRPVVPAAEPPPDTPALPPPPIETPSEEPPPAEQPPDAPDEPEDEGDPAPSNKNTGPPADNRPLPPPPAPPPPATNTPRTDNSNGTGL